MTYAEMIQEGLQTYAPLIEEGMIEMREFTCFMLARYEITGEDIERYFIKQKTLGKCGIEFINCHCYVVLN